MFNLHIVKRLGLINIRTVRFGTVRAASIAGLKPGSRAPSRSIVPLLPCGQSQSAIISEPSARAPIDEEPHGSATVTADRVSLAMIACA